MWFIIVLVYISSAASDEVPHAVWFRTILKIQNEFHPSSNIFIAQGEDFNDLRISNVFMTMLKQLSKENVFAIVTRIADMPKGIHYCRQSKNRQLFVVILKSITDVVTFSRITRTTDLSLYRTLVLFSENTSDFCHNPVGNPFNLNFDSKMLVKCEGSSVVQEWYSIHKNTTKVANLFILDPKFNVFVKLTKLNFYERRKSLEGFELRVVTRSVFNFAGVYANVLMEIAQAANFKVRIQPHEKNAGSYDENTKMWSGLVGRLQKKEADIGLSRHGFSMTHNRLEAVDYSKTILSSRTEFYIKNLSKSNLMWSMYYNAIGIKAVYCLLAIIIGSPIVLTAIVAKQKQTSYRTILWDNYLYVWRTFCINSSSEPTNNLSTKIACLSLLVTAYVLYSVYSTLLVSYLTVFKPDKLFHSLEEFADAKTHRIMTFKNTSLIESIEISDDPMMKRLRTLMLKDYDLPDSFVDVYEQVCDSDKNLVLFANDIVMKSKGNIYPCELISFGIGTLSHKSLLFVKDSPYKGLFDYYLQKMRDSGLLAVLINRNLKTLSPATTVYEPATLWSTLPIFGILGIGMLLSLLMFLCEDSMAHMIHRQYIRN